ncbi:MAG TPA: type II toxin-antitoxin system prevent-host-death family antitoxin [Thermoanaerobaculia bacterium]|nr:type II toxin-antitoxin system prevent-host-death family antitoxin [Thermoanaerobaculia bacterium]
MKTASVTDTKNRLSAILKQVQEGETYLILDRGKPIARLEPVVSESRTSEHRRGDLERRGLLRRGRGKVRREILDTEPPRLPGKVSAVALLIEERAEGR